MATLKVSDQQLAELTDTFLRTRRISNVNFLPFELLKKRIDLRDVVETTLDTHLKGVYDLLMKRVNFHLTEDQIKKLKSLAAKTGLKEAEHIRRAIDDYLDKKERKP